MTRIAGVLRPFDRRQNFFVYEDGNNIDQVSVTLDELNDTIMALSEKYNATRLDLNGPKQYARGLAKRLEEAEMTKYNELKLQINIV